MLAGRCSLTLHSRSEGSTLVFPMVKVMGLPTARYRGRLSHSQGRRTASAG